MAATDDVRARVLEQLVVKPGTPAAIAARDPGWTEAPTSSTWRTTS